MLVRNGPLSNRQSHNPAAMIPYFLTGAAVFVLLLILLAIDKPKDNEP